MDTARSFYDTVYARGEYGPCADPEQQGFYPDVRRFIDTYGLQGKRCLEVGAGNGAFQHMVSDYTGIDITSATSHLFDQPFYVASATALPFSDSSFDAIWSLAVLEHIPEPQRALDEIRRVLRPGGVLLLAPAWQCRPWKAEGYEVRPFSDFDWKGKLVKASIPLREPLPVRLAYVMPRRVMNAIRNWRSGQVPFRYRPITPNYEHYWISDADACNWMDPYDAIAYFTHRGDECLSHPTRAAQLLVRTGGLVFRKHG